MLNSIKKSDYEILLAEYCDRTQAIALLQQHRPYLEMLPSLRRPEDSLISIPLPVVRIRSSPIKETNTYLTPAGQETISLPCDLAILMCDPEWKVKMGVEICVFIHRPGEDFSDLLNRWRQTQVLLDKEYEWLMPHHYNHIYSSPAEEVYPLFVVFSQTAERIKRGLSGAYLPFVVENKVSLIEEKSEALSSEIPPT